MNVRRSWIPVLVALLFPVAAWAQHPAAPAPPADASRPAAPAPAVANDDLALDELLGPGFGDELMALGDGDDGSIEDSVGPNGSHRIVGRRVERMPGMHGGMGMRHGGGLMGQGRHGPGMRARWAELGLTDEQRTKIRDLHEVQARKAVQRRADMQLAKLDLHKLMREDRPNTASVNSQIDKLARLHAEGMKAAFSTRLQARALLTAEQRKQLESGPHRGMHHEMGDFEAPPKR